MKGSRADARRRRHFRVRRKVHGTAARPRMAVFRSNRYIYAQLIDDEAGATIASASSRDGSLAGGGLTVDTAVAVGKLLATRAKEAGIDVAVFDRGGYQYHGRVKGVAEGARQGGLEF